MEALKVFNNTPKMSLPSKLVLFLLDTLTDHAFFPLNKIDVGKSKSEYQMSIQ